MLGDIVLFGLSGREFKFEVEREFEMSGSSKLFKEVQIIDSSRVREVEVELEERAEREQGET